MYWVASRVVALLLVVTKLCLARDSVVAWANGIVKRGVLRCVRATIHIWVRMGISSRVVWVAIGVVSIHCCLFPLFSCVCMCMCVVACVVVVVVVVVA